MYHVKENVAYLCQNFSLAGEFILLRDYLLTGHVELPYSARAVAYYAVVCTLRRGLYITTTTKIYSESLNLKPTSPSPVNEAISHSGCRETA